MTDPIKYDLDLAEEPLELTLKGKTREYIIRELTGEDRDTYLQGVAKRTKMHEGKVTGINNVKGLQSSLLTQALFYVETETETEKNVAEKDIQKWPSRVVKALYEKVRDMNGLDDEDEDDDSKND